MPIFPELNGLSLPELINQFEGDLPPEEQGLYLEEVAIRIRKQGPAGLNYLLQQYDKVTEANRKRAILVGIVHLDTEQQTRVKELLFRGLNENHPDIISTAIDGLMIMGETKAVDIILPYLENPSPYVRGSAIRYISRLHPQRALPILNRAANDPDEIVRMYAADELGNTRLEKTEALEILTRLAQDESSEVRESAEWSLKEILEDNN